MNEIGITDLVQMLLRPGVILSLVGAGFAARHLKHTRWALVLLGAFAATALLSVVEPIAMGLTILGSTPSISAVVGTLGVVSWLAYAGLVGGVIGVLSQLAAVSQASRQPPTA